MATIAQQQALAMAAARRRRAESEASPVAPAIAAAQPAYGDVRIGMGDYALGKGLLGGVAASLASQGTGIIQRVAEGEVNSPGQGLTTSGLYSKILSMVRPDLAPEFANLTSEDVRRSAGNVGARLGASMENQGITSNIGQLAGNVAPYLAIPGGPFAAGAVSGATSGALQPNQAQTAQLGNSEALSNALYGGAGGAIVGKVLPAVTPTIPQVWNGTKNITRSVLNKTLGINKEAVDEFAQAGIDPILAQVGGRGSRIADSTLKNIPFSGGVIQKGAQDAIDKLATKVEDVAGTFGPYKTNQETGAVIQKGANAFIDRFKDSADDLFKNTRKSFQPGELTPVSNTSAFLSKQGEGLTENLKVALANPKLRSVADAITKDSVDGQLPYEAVLAARSKIGRELSDSVMSDIPRADLKQFYGALTEDLKAAAAAKGPKELTAFNRANNYYKAGIDRIESSLSGLVQKGADPESVYQIATSGSKDGATKLLKIKKSLTADEFGALQGQTIRRMGLAKASSQDASGEVFSPETFLTNWNKLSPEAKGTLFKGDVATSLEKLTKVASRYKDVSKLTNASNTANNLGLISLGAAGLTNPVATVAGVGAAYGSAKLMTNPRFVNWLSDSANKHTPTATTEHIKKLTTIAINSDPDTREDIQGFLKTVVDHLQK